MPDSASVRDRMVYSSSSSALRDGLGSSAFLPQTWNLREQDHCTAAEFDDTGKALTDEDLMTNDELAAKEAETSSHLAMSSTRVSAIVGLPIKVAEGSAERIAALKDAKGRSVLLKLDGESETLSVEDEGEWTFEEAATRLPAGEPRYLLTHFHHQFQDEPQTAYGPTPRHPHPHSCPLPVRLSTCAHLLLVSSLLACAAVFYYYCPDAIKPKLKMFYSTAKSIVLKLCDTNYSLPITRSLEISDRQEMTTAQVLDALHPAEAAKKAFKKPARPGRGNARLIGRDASTPSPTPVPAVGDS